MLTLLMYFELKYYSKQIICQAAAILFFMLGFLMAQGNFGGPEIHKNGPYVINFIVCLLSLLLAFVTALSCASTVLRDKNHRMDALIYATGIKLNPYFFVKIAGLVLAVLFMLSVAVTGTFLGSFLASSEQKGTFNVLYYLHPILIFGLPNVFFCCSIIFSTALITQSARAVYVTGVLLFILYFVGSILGNSPLLANSALKPDGPDLFSLLIDPFGITAYFGQTRSWSVLRKNTMLFGLEGAFLINRLLWVAVSMAVLAFTYHRFRFGLKSGSKGKTDPVAVRTPPFIPYRSVPTAASGLRYHFSVFSSQFSSELVFLFKQPLSLLLLALWTFLYVIELKENVFHGPFNMRFLASNALVINELMSVKPALLLLVFYGSELVHREQTARILPLVYGTPVSRMAIFSAKLAVLIVLIALLISLNIITGLCTQLFAGNSQFDLMPYLSLYYYCGLPLLLWALFVIFIQTSISNKYLGMLVSLAVIGFFTFASQFGIHHDLLRFAGAPPLVYSTMNGFGHYKQAFNGYMLYWSGLAIILVVFSIAWWQDGTIGGRLRLKMGLKNWNTPMKIATVSGMLIWLCTGIYIIKKTPLTNASRTGKASRAWQKAYEQRYKSQAIMSQPVITAVHTKMDIFPAQKTYNVSGSYEVRNKSGQAVSELWLGVDPEVTAISLKIPGAASTEIDDHFNQYFYTLKKPLQPGEAISIRFSLQVSRSDFAAFNSENSVTDNGSYIELEKYLPFFGYNADFEIDDQTLRKENNLPTKTASLAADKRYHLIDYETTISTDSSQHAVAVGKLEKSWKSSGRAYFHYKTAEPIAFMLAVSSARYAKAKEVYRGIAFEIFYHPGQIHNIRAIMWAMKDAIDYCSRVFGPYPLKHMTLAEIPAYPGSATAYPGVIFSQEKLNFLADFSDTTKFNYTYATTAHEVAHQWWANKISPVSSPGDALLTESLAKYTEAMVVEKRFGKMYLRNYLQADNSLYFSLRSRVGERELPLYRTWQQPFVCYQKGGLALYAIKELIGEEKLNEALAQFITKYSPPAEKPTAADLINLLRLNVTRDQSRLIDEHLKKIVVYSNSAKILSIKPLSSGKFQLRVQINVQKTDESEAKPKILPASGFVDVAIFGEDQNDWNRHTKPIYVKQHYFSKSQTVLIITVDKKPKVAAIDPFGFLLDENLEDNLAKL